jgi:hypothetical protein
MAAGLVKAIIISASYTPNIDTHTRYRDVSAHEVSVADPGRIVAYNSGGLAVSASIVISADNGNDRGTLDAADISWPSATITGRYLVLVKVRASGANKELDNLIGYVDFVTDQSSSNGAYTIQWNSVGIITFS